MSAPDPSPPDTTPEITTIGYEQSTVDHVIAALKEAGVARLVDIRAVAGSRKPGFSKRQLQAAAEEAGIEYVHLRALGTPKPGRDAARKGDAATMHRIYAAHIATPEADAELARAVAMTGETPCCLLCFERDHSMCHRDLLAGMIRKRTGARVRHLIAEAV